MSTTTSTVEPTTLDDVINEALAQLKNYPAHSDEYAQIVKQVEKLIALKPKPEKAKQKQSVSLETLLPVLGNLAGIGLILQHERLHVVTSKALGFVTKTKM